LKKENIADEGKELWQTEETYADEEKSRDKESRKPC
jgi:hypothetical protein